MIVVATTDRLRLRHVTTNDTAFLVELLNDPSFLTNIGDRGVRSGADAIGYVESGPGASYRKNGFGLYLVETKDGATPLGLCGLVRRDTLPDVDIGFAFLPQFHGQGYAYEAARATVDEARDRVKLRRLVAIVKPGNLPSSRLLVKLGLKFERMIRLPHDPLELEYYGIDFPR
jgi:ribosomal-protein-alanine N-acetyltransferase